VSVSIKADFSKMGPDFGNKSPKIIAKLISESAENVLNHIEKEEKFVLKVDNETFNIVKEHIIVNRTIPLDYVETPFKGGTIYLSKKVSPELEAEGYAREVMRRVQALRKDSGLVKQDSISLFIQTNEQGASLIEPFIDQIQEKVGADKIEVAMEAPSKKYSHSAEEKVKEIEFKLWLEKV